MLHNKCVRACLAVVIQKSISAISVNFTPDCVEQLSPSSVSPRRNQTLLQLISPISRCQELQREVSHCNDMRKCWPHRVQLDTGVCNFLQYFFPWCLIDVTYCFTQRGEWFLRVFLSFFPLASAPHFVGFIILYQPPQMHSHSIIKTLVSLVKKINKKSWVLRCLWLPFLFFFFFLSHVCFILAQALTRTGLIYELHSYFIKANSFHATVFKMSLKNKAEKHNIFQCPQRLHIYVHILYIYIQIYDFTTIYVYMYKYLY